MPSASQLYGSGWLKASDLMPLGKRRHVSIVDAAPETVGQDQKEMLALTLAGSNGQVWSKRMLLNKTNMLLIVSAYGDDYTTWTGRSIEVWSENVSFQGRIVPGLKIMPAARKAPPQAAPVHEVPPDADPDSGMAITDDEIPF